VAVGLITLQSLSKHFVAKLETVMTIEVPPRPTVPPVLERSGNVSINNGQYLDGAVPFSGMKQSGYGSELGPEGLDGYLHNRVVFLDAPPFHGLG
jgi:hypothetical protein